MPSVELCPASPVNPVHCLAHPLTLLIPPGCVSLTVALFLAPAEDANQLAAAAATEAFLTKILKPAAH